MFSIARAIIGFGIPMAIVSASSLIAELAYPKERPYLGSLFNVSWFCGAIIAAGTVAILTILASEASDPKPS